MQTNPKTLGVAVYCPVDLDDETGPFLHSRSMEQGYYCRPLADYPTELEVRPLYPLITDGLRCLTCCARCSCTCGRLRSTAGAATRAASSWPSCRRRRPQRGR